MESYLEQAIRKYPDAGATPRLAESLAAIRSQKIRKESDRDDPGKHLRGSAAALDLVLANDRLPAYLRERLTGNRDADLAAAENRKRERR